MTYYSVSKPYEVFFDDNGDPLEDGYIYIGEVNENPITNPITVTWDEDGVYPAAQPIRTIAGYPSRNGSPGNLFVNGADYESYSILVQDKNQNFIYSNYDAVIFNFSQRSSVETIDDLRSIGYFDQPIYVQGHTTINDGGQGFFLWNNGAAPGTYTDDNGITILPTSGDGGGAWVRDWQGFEAEIEWFGAKNDASADVSTIISAAVASIPKGGVLKMFGRYRFDDQAEITKPGVTIRGPFENTASRNNAPDSNEFTESYLLCNFDDNTKAMFYLNASEISLSGFHLYMDNTDSNVVTMDSTATGCKCSYLRAQHCGGDGITTTTATRLRSCTVAGRSAGAGGIVTGSHGFDIETDNFVSNCRCENFDIGVYISGNHNQIVNSYSDLSNVGWSISGTNNKLSNLKAAYNHETGFLLDGGVTNTRYNNLVGCMAYENDDHGFKISGNINDCSLTGCMAGAYTTGSGQAYGLYIEDSTNKLYVSGCVFRSNDTTDLYIDPGHTNNAYFIGNDIGQSPYSLLINFRITAGALTAVNELGDLQSNTVTASFRSTAKNKMFYDSASAVTSQSSPFYSGTFQGQIARVINVGSFNITFKHGSNTYFNAGTDKILTPNQGFSVMWTGSLWVEI